MDASPSHNPSITPPILHPADFTEPSPTEREYHQTRSGIIRPETVTREKRKYTRRKGAESEGEDKGKGEEGLGEADEVGELAGEIIGGSDEKETSPEADTDGGPESLTNLLRNAEFLAKVVIENEELDRKRAEIGRKINERLDKEGFVYHRNPAKVQQTQSSASITGRKYFPKGFEDVPAEGRDSHCQHIQDF